jgi:hypothetical protein
MLIKRSFSEEREMKRWLIKGCHTIWKAGNTYYKVTNPFSINMWKQILWEFHGMSLRLIIKDLWYWICPWHLVKYFGED